MGNNENDNGGLTVVVTINSNVDEVIKKLEHLIELMEKVDRKLNEWLDFDGVKDSMAKGIQNALNNMGSGSSEGQFTQLPEPQQISGTAHDPIC